MPVKSFRFAKLRLATVMAANERVALARELAVRVLGAGRPLPTYVVCDDDEVATFATGEGAQVLWTPGRGLSGAVGSAVAHLGARGVDLVVVAHADLPFVPPLAEYGVDDAVTLAPDRFLDGTNVVAVPSQSGFRFSYGPGSFARHRAEGERLGLTVHVVEDWRLATDVDNPSDIPLVR